MASLLTHPAIAIATRLGSSRRAIPTPLLLAGIAATALPDADAIGFWLGVPYGSLFGHRGFSHSFCFALLLGAIAALFARRLRQTPLFTFAFISLCAASHPILDAATSGGLGVAFFSPFSNHRYFFPSPLRVIRVAPIGVRAFLSARGLLVLSSELRWVWLPLLTTALTARLLHHLRHRRHP